MAETVLIAGASVRAAAQSARRAGFSPIGVDLFGDQDLASCCPCVQVSDYPRGLELATRGITADAWMYTGGLENYPDLVDRLSSRWPLWGVSGQALRVIRDPRAWPPRLDWKSLAQLGVCLPETRWSPLDAGQDWSGWLLKSPRSAAGLGVATANADHPPRLGDRYLQRRVSGRSLGALCLAAGGRGQLLGVCRQLQGPRWGHPHQFGYAGSLGPLVLPPRAVEQWSALVDQLAARLPLSGLFGVDAIATGGRLWVLEINPRYTASAELYERCTGVPLLRRHRAAIVGTASNRQDPVPADFVRSAGRAAAGRQPPACCGKLVLFAPTQVVWTRTLQTLLQDAMSPACDGGGPLELADLPNWDTCLETDAPALTVLAQGPGPSAVARRLAAAASQFRQLLLTR